MSATQDFVALEWIRGELAKTLQSAQVALEAVAESPDDSSSMRSCLTAIHQVHGTLKMVQLEGPTLLAGEMEAVAQALMNNSVSDVSLGQETLMQAILQLPAYLDRLHREQTDRESNYLPIMNNLRVVRGEDRIPGTESAETETAAGPDLSPLTREPGDQVVNTFFQGNGEGNLPKIRARYQASLAAILKKKDIRENLSMLGKLFTMLDRLCGDSPMGNLAEIGLAVVEGVASGGIRLDNNTATLLRGIDGEIKRLAEEGQEGLSKPIDPELGLNLIALVKSASKDTKNIVAVRNRYKTIAPRQEEVSMGPDDETMSAVARILIEELNAVTDKLDLYVRSEKPDTAELIDLRPNLERISSTMVILGDKAQQSSVARQIEVIKGIEAGADPDEETLLGMAQALLQIESSLGTLVTDGDDGDKDDFADLDEAQAAVVRETRSGLASAKDAVIDFISSDFDASKISSLPVDLSALRGGLTIVNQPRAGDVLTAAASYVRSQLLEAGVRPELDQMDDLADAITSVDYYLERLLENAGDPYLQMLEVAESAVAKLGFAVGAKPAPASVEEPSAEPVEEPSAEVVEPSAEPVEEPSAEVVEPSAELVEEPSAELVEEPSAELVEEPSAEVVEPSAEPEEEPSAEVVEPSAELEEEPSAELVEEPSAELVEEPSAEPEEEPSAELIEEPSAELVEEPSAKLIEEPSAEIEEEPAEPEEDNLIDDEILEIFIEEAGEVLETLNEFLPAWRENPQGEEALTEIRRAFHTLKGSGRMVGATVVGELAWSIENLLNRVLDGTVAPGPEVQDIVTTVVARIPEGVDAFKAGRQESFETTGMSAIADALAEGLTVAAEEPSAELEEEPALSLEIEELEVEESTVYEIDEDEEFELDSLEDTAAATGGPEETDELLMDAVEELEDIEFESADAEDEILTLELEEEPSAEFEEEPAVSLEIDDLEVEEPTVYEIDDDEGFELESMELDSLEDTPAASDGLEETDEQLLDAVDELEDIDFESLDTDTDDLALGLVEESSAEEEPSAEEEAPTDTIELDTLEDLELESLDTEPAGSDVPSLESPVLDTAEALLESDDLELEEIFALEAAEKLDIIEAFVSARAEVDSDLVAAFHTLKGSAAMAEIPAIAEIAAPLEHLANDYLIQNGETDDFILACSEQAAQLIRQVLTDIDRYRVAVEGSQALIAKVAAGAGESEPAPNFDFQQIILLSEANIAADGWQDVDALIAELKHADEQAIALNQSDLSALIRSMLRVYSESPGKPDDQTLALMMRAHDHLVSMFDALASSQKLRPATRVIADLDAIVLEPPADEVAAVPDTAEQTAPEPAPLADTGQVVELPADDIDEDILPIFLEEIEELQEEIDESIQGWAESGEPGGHLDNLLRQLHTVKGGARMAGLASLGEYAHNFETFLIGVQSTPVPFDEAFFALLNAQQDEITRRVEIYQKYAAGSATQAELDSLRSAAAPAAEAAPAAAVSVQTQTDRPAPAPAAAVVTDALVELPEDHVDDDILPIFLEESDDLVEELESSIQSWSESPGDTDTLDVLLRNLHTLKGGARMAGLNSLGEYAHNFETFLIGIQQNPVELDDDFFALLNKRQDEVIRRVEIYKRLSVGAASDEDLASLRQALEPTLETVPAQDDESGQPAQQVGEAKSRPAPAGDKQAVSASQEMIRVSADLLEELISMAGESSITRGRIEQQITDFGEALQEMEETINRIREQVRRLEIEAESRETLIRSRAEADSGDFDELEMDRYTMLQATSRALNEATSDMMDLKDTLVNRSRDAETLLHQQARISGELQEGLTRTSMVPFARLIPRLRRIVRQVSGEVGKSVRFDAYNVEGELDRNVLEKIVAPLEHMLRNAVDHGIEEKEKRLQVGKPEQGRISLRLSREGGYVVLTISDDGGGINVDAVRSKAIERGLMSAKQPLSDHDIMQFILHAGFSTAQKLTQISGRGVGMDVVVSEIKALGGSITIDSTLGVGTEFTIRIPFTVSINRALMVIVREETYAVPLNTIEGIVRVSPYELEAYYQPDAPMFEYAGQPYRLGYMGKMLDMGGDDPNLSGQVAPLPVLLARSGDHAVALQVDRVVGSREVVVKTLGAQFADVGGISGATVLGDGSVVIILDCMALVRSYEAQRDAGAALMEAEPAPEPAASVRTVMIVDDSVTVRKVTSRLMERNGYEVETAKDGVDAMNQLQEIRPDVMLLDIEMPRMDGFEVLRSVRRDEAIKDLPIIMITSRTGEKHKQQAMELGVNGYLGKPFQEANLLATIEEVIENAKKAGSTQE